MILVTVMLKFNGRNRPIIILFPACQRTTPYHGQLSGSVGKIEVLPVQDEASWTYWTNIWHNWLCQDHVTINLVFRSRTGCLAYGVLTWIFRVVQASLGSSPITCLLFALREARCRWNEDDVVGFHDFPCVFSQNGPYHAVSFSFHYWTKFVPWMCFLGSRWHATATGSNPLIPDFWGVGMGIPIFFGAESTDHNAW